MHKVQLKNQHNEVFYHKLSFMYLETPNFNKTLEQLETRLGKWLYFIKNLEDLQSIPELLKDKVFISAFETAKLANLSSSERQNYEQRLKIMRDNYATQKYAIETAVAEAEIRAEARGREAGIAEGQARGRESGITEGEAKGELKAKLEIAKNLKATGLSQEQIQVAMGLSAEILEQNGIS